MNDGQNVGTRFIAPSNKKPIEIHEPDAASYTDQGGDKPRPYPTRSAPPGPYRVRAGLVPALETTNIANPALETVFVTNTATCELDAEGHCITCSDEAVTVQVLRVDSQTGIALVTIQDKTEEVDITLVEDVVPGDWLLVHGGVAIANANEANDA